MDGVEGIAEVVKMADRLPMPSQAGPSFAHCGAVTAPELRDALGVALVEAREATVAWLRLARLAFFPMSCGVQKLAYAVRPYARRAAVAFAAQPREVLLVELSVLLLMLLVWRVRIVLRRRRYLARLRQWTSARISRPVATRYMRFKDGVRRRSRVVARAMPHAGFALACFVALRALRALGLSSLLQAGWSPLSWFLLTSLPWVRTLLTLRSDGTGERSVQRDWLRFWVLWSAWHLAAGVLAAIPFASRFVPRVSLDTPTMAPLVACAAVWVHLPHDGLEICYGVVGPAIAFRAQRLSDAVPSLPAGLLDKLAMVLRLLTPSGVYTAIMQAAQEGYLLLGVTICMLTPYPLTGLALIYWSLGYPILKSIEVLEMPTAHPDMATHAAYASQVQLCYWLLHCALAALLDQLPWLLWLPFSTHVRMLIAVWLQLPYFRAATMLMLQLTPFGRALLRLTGGSASDNARVLTASGAPATPPHASPSAIRHTRSPRANAIYSKRLQQQPGSSRSGTPDSQPQRPHQE
jgi:hypothetical protein